jgi:hypothetical protein
MHHDFPFFFWLSSVLTSSALVITGPLCSQLVRCSPRSGALQFCLTAIRQVRKSPFHPRLSNFRRKRESVRRIDRHQGVDDTFVSHPHHGLNHQC